MVDVETPEQVVFSYSVAGIGTRAAAAVVDMLITLTGTFLTFLLIVAVLISLRGSVSGSDALERLSEGWVLAILLILQFLIMWGYHFVFEGFRDGQTPGKRLLRIRVVRDGGFAVTPQEAGIRNIMRAIDMMPPVTYVVGMIAVALSRSGKRLGDMVAGTMVVRERVMREQLPVARPDEERPVAVTAALSEPEYMLLEQFLSRLGALTGAARAALVGQLTTRFAAHLSHDAGSAEAALSGLYESERRARDAGMAARGDVGAARERHAIVREGAERWQRFSTRLRSAQRLGLRRMSEKEVSEFVAEYREIATDLARLRTATGGGGEGAAHSDEVFYLSRLVAAGHNLLYHQAPVSGRAVFRYLTVRVPAEIRRSALPILGAALLLFAPMLITYAVVRADPALTERILPEGMFDRATEGTVRSVESGGYIIVSPTERPVLAAQVMTNNLQVTFLVFALGITAGIGTIFVLVTNGIAIGGAVGLYANMGIASLILDFMIPHGVFELTAVCLGGGAGLLLARALLLPGNLDRVSALKVQGRRAIDLIVAASLMLILAGLIEGLISPRPELPAALRLGVAGLSAVIIVAYVSLGRGAGPDEAVDQSEDRALIAR